MCENGAANFVSASLSGNRQAHVYFKLYSSHFGYIRVILAKYKHDRFGWFESAFGTERRSQLKADKIKEPVRSQDESLDSFRFRLAGFCFFQLFLQEIFQVFANLIPASFDISRYYWPKRQLP